MSAGELESALESTYDIGEVSVSYSEDSNSTRSYKVTFEVSIWGSCFRLANNLTAFVDANKQANFIRYECHANVLIIP